MKQLQLFVHNFQHEGHYLLFRRVYVNGYYAKIELDFKLFSIFFGGRAGWINFALWR